MEVPLTKEDEEINKWDIGINKTCVIPCSYKDYEQAGQGVIPDRWIVAVNKRL
ncbi:hypothetical protein [Mangrovivirga cuniculi]|uniref:hypothetical protein n=1 Tax=Mangrovivirga cuniculi TaxID=2715131 RepID=UPI001FECD100|nr:hypothetical protein [Mangrovivirga cuniculi]